MRIHRAIKAGVDNLLKEGSQAGTVSGEAPFGINLTAKSLFPHVLMEAGAGSKVRVGSNIVNIDRDAPTFVVHNENGTSKDYAAEWYYLDA